MAFYRPKRENKIYNIYILLVFFFGLLESVFAGVRGEAGARGEGSAPSRAAHGEAAGGEGCCGAEGLLRRSLLLRARVPFVFFFVFRARNYFGPIGLLICWVCHALFVVA